MPVIFSPGEPETRPLDPTAIVYTTAQKVADLLSIGPQEAVLMSANAEANAVFVTGGDYRNTGFSVGDTILIYSDADPMGQEHAITAITTSVNGVKLSFAASINPGLYETADNAYVQNTASFTNGKTRGMKKSVVETRIKEVQDRIDNITHNAWRPYVVHAEYINFDTYKPYRRRYYTDYVGTTPLLFRNVQQILKLEVWQGEHYKELAGASATLKIKEGSSGVSNPHFYLGLPNGAFGEISEDTVVSSTTWTTVVNSGTGYTSGTNISTTGGSGTGMKVNTTAVGGAISADGIAIHTAGTGYVTGDTITVSGGGANAQFKIYITDATATNKYSSEFNELVHTHQDLADVINQEDRTGKTSIEMVPTFKLPGSSSNITLKDEFMAVANSDYGSGQLRLTSMRQSAGGRSSTVASNSGVLADISDVDTITGYVRFEGPLVSATVTTAGTGYSAGNVAATASTGTASALPTVTVTVSGGEVTGISGIHVAGNYLRAGDVLTFGSGGFTATITSVQPTGGMFHTDENGTPTSNPTGLVPGVIRLEEPTQTGIVMSIETVGSSHITSFMTIYSSLNSSFGGTAATKLTQYKLSTDIEHDSSTGEQKRLGDWWLDHEMGIIYFNNTYPFFEWNAVKVSYIYGERYLEKAIEEAATKLVAADLLMSDDRSVLIPEGSQNVDLGAKIQLYRKEAEEILSRYKEVVVFA